MIVFILILHGLCAVALLGAITHQTASLWIPAKAGGPLARRFRAVNPAVFTNAVIVLFLVTFALGSFVYPAYRIGARVYFEQLRMSRPVGLFEVKEHLLSFALGLLPAYYYYWKGEPPASSTRTRAIVVLVIAVFIWSAFLIGHVVNNAKGV
jgi:hypothetical protein